MQKYSMEDISGNGCRIRYTFEETNSKGERVAFDLTHCTNPGGAHSLPERWRARGWTDRVLQSWIGVDTYVTDSAGNCRRAYDPTVDESQRVIDFRFMLEDTPANRARLIAEIARRAFG